MLIYANYHFQTLLDLGAGVNYRDDRGLTPLYHAVCHSTNANCVNLLLYNYAAHGTVDTAGWTELHQVQQLLSQPYSISLAWPVLV